MRDTTHTQQQKLKSPLKSVVILKAAVISNAISKTSKNNTGTSHFYSAHAATLFEAFIYVSGPEFNPQLHESISKEQNSNIGVFP